MKVQTKKKTYINVSNNSSSKQIICDRLCEAIQQTSAGDDLEALRYDPQKRNSTRRFYERIRCSTDQRSNGLRLGDDQGHRESHRYRVTS